MASKNSVGLTVLVIEEQRAVRKIIEQIFNTIGFDFVELAEDGNEALSWLEEGGLKFDILVTDHHMDKMGGIEFSQKVRAAQGTYYQDLPIILLTSDSVEDLAEEAKTVGISNILQKPFSPMSMKQEIEKIIGFAL
ncbi:MAG: response regulator [Rhodospirillales bacterium]|nr:response regulator [Rhodospirillales bacterium]